MKRAFRLTLEFAAAFIAVLATTFLLLAWWAASEPLSSTNLTPYIESALEKMLPGTQAEIAATQLSWNNDDFSLALNTGNIKLRDPKGNLLAELPSMKMRARIFSLLRGRIIPSDLALEHPRLWLTRRADDVLSVGAPAPDEEKTKAPEALNALRIFLNDITREGALRDLAVTDVEIAFFDEKTGQSGTISIPEISLRQDGDNLKGLAHIEVSQKKNAALVEAHYSFERKIGQHSFSLRANNITPAQLAWHHPDLAILTGADLPLTGEAAFTADRKFNVTTANLHMEAGEGTLVAPPFWDAPRHVKSLALAATYDRKAHRLDVPTASIDFGGPLLMMNLQAVEPPVGTPKPNDMGFTLNIKLNNLPMNDFASVWPTPFITNARAWIMENMSQGQFTKSDLTLYGRYDWNDIGNLFLEKGEGTVSASSAHVTYMRDMPAVEDVNAEAAFDLDHMDVRLSGGGVGALRIQPHTIQLTDFQKPVQYIVIPLKFTGPARDVIKLIDSPPLGYAKAIGLKAEDGEGRVEGTLNMRLPLLNALLMKDVELSAEAKISDFASKKLVPGLELSQGQLALNLDKKGFTLNGPTALNKVPMQINWQYRFGAEESAPDNPRMQATVAGNVTGEQWTQLGLDFTEKQKGPAAVALRYAQTGPATSQLSGDINFRQAALNIAELGWKKAVNVPANLSFAADIPEGKNINVKTISLQGQGIRAKGTAKLDGKTMQLLALDFQPLVVGRTNANLHFTQSFGPRGSLSLAADGESFDISGLSGDKKPAEADTRPKDYAIKLKKLHTSEDGFIANVMGHARRDKEGWVEIDLHGLADGSHPLDIILQQRGEKRIFGITCDDFGKALKGMGFTDTVRDGELEIKGESTPENPRMIEGQAKVGHFVVSGLPVLMRLLSAVSPFGFVDLITGNTSFDHMEGGFRWHGETIELVKMRAAGSVFGINVEGKVDLGNGNANLHGTLVPFSFFNSVINVIPLLGNVITGGEGQGVIAASYNVDGPLSDPSISVNPVSLLTPGFLRNLFFAEDEEKKPEAAPAAP